ncbi:MAG: YerC/YecD family TrpR-related protein [Eubacteriales bacterium]|nr:YerC/YecD family TrpR-related protein [Eubacteriales bacterium]
MDAYESRMKSPELDDVFHAILSLRDLSECYRFFEDMCTINELQAIAQRWQVARQLDAGVTYQEISHRYNASTATISRVNRCLEYGAGGYRLLLDRAKQKE